MNQPQNLPKILIVDDMPANIKVLVETLRPQYEILVATHGRNALKLAVAEKPDLILLDIVMPEMDGYEVCGKLKMDPVTRNIPVIFITAKTEEDDETRGLEIGAIDYITKPFSTAIVLSRIKTHLGLKQAREKIENQNRELLAADRLKEDVNRIIRHDLKTPLNTIIGFSSAMLMNEGLSQKNKEYLGVINDAGYQLLKMINQSTDLLKMEQGTYILEAVPVNLRETLQKIIKANKTMMENKMISITIRRDGETTDCGQPFLVIGEELLCFSLFANLIKNALEASPNNSGVSLSLNSTGEGAEVSIHNKGGVSAPIKDQFFDKYVTSGKKQGTGLGTYSAKLIAQTQNGSIHLDASDDRSTTVTVRLPALI